MRLRKNLAQAAILSTRTIELALNLKRFLLGGAVGATWGGFKGLIDAERGLPWKLRLNAFLNGAGRKGGRMANGLGALVLLYSGIETAAWGARQKQDGLNIVAGTTLAPLIYWSGGAYLPSSSFLMLSSLSFL
jgi:hypothetical protein